LGWRVDPGGGRFERRFWRLFDEALGIGLEGAVENYLAGCVDLIGLTVVGPGPASSARGDVILDDGPCFPPPGKQQARRHAMATRDRGHLRARRQCLRDDPHLFVVRPTPAPFDPAEDFNPHKDRP